MVGMINHMQSDRLVEVNKRNRAHRKRKRQLMKEKLRIAGISDVPGSLAGLLDGGGALELG